MSAEGELTLRYRLDPVEVYRYEATEAISGPDEPDHWPAKVVASALLTLWFGPGSRAPRTSKSIRRRVVLASPSPTGADWTAAIEKARADLAVAIALHGLPADVVAAITGAGS